MIKIKIIFRVALLFTILSLLHYEGYSQKYILPNRILSIAGFKPGRIPQSLFAQSTQIEVKPPYTFISAVIYIGDTTGNKCVHSTSLNGNLFDDKIKGVLKILKSRMLNLVTFGEIKVMNKSGQILTVEDASFIVSMN